MTSVTVSLPKLTSSLSIRAPNCSSVSHLMMLLQLLKCTTSINYYARPCKFTIPVWHVIRAKTKKDYIAYIFLFYCILLLFFYFLFRVKLWHVIRAKTKKDYIAYIFLFYCIFLFFYFLFRVKREKFRNNRVINRENRHRGTLHLD